jgi:beta-glucosidase
MTGVPIEASMLSHDGKRGLLRTDGTGTMTVDAQLDFTSSNQKALAANGSFTWKGTLTVPSEGVYWIYLQALGARAALQIDGKGIGRTGANQGDVHGDIQQAAQDNTFPTTDGLDNVRRAVRLTAGQHDIKVEASGDTSGNPEQVRLNWVTPDRRLRDHQAAIEAAKSVHTPIVFLWTRGEPNFGLPGEQNKLVEEIAVVNANTIVVLYVSQAIAMPWLSKVKAVLQMWWPGDEGGWATADILLGKVNPAGRLPFTWAKRLEDYPATDPGHPERSAKGVDGKTTFSEGVDVGYRWFDKQKTEPLFPFGFGLSYSSFSYSDLNVVKAADGGLDVSVKIKNVGPLSGDDVPQVYLDAPLRDPEGVQFAPKTLAAFERVTVGVGESKQVRLHVLPRSLEYWSVAENRWVRSSERRLRVGGSSRDLKLESAAQ